MNSTDNILVPSKIGEQNDWSVISSGNMSTCGIRSGELYCQGYNAYGQLGNGSTTNSNEFVRVGNKSDWENISVQNLSACGIRSGELYCWGANWFGKLGTGDTENSLIPEKAGSYNDWSIVKTGGFHSCGIRNGELYCWGSNILGQLGDGTNGSGSDKTSPIRIGNENNWSDVSTGYSYTCGILSNKLYCWGSNSDGQLGNGKAWELTPVEVVEP
jgi:alpha-tubulin suppressor-like RCC1 family protein